jgi:hypothetical protein
LISELGSLKGKGEREKGKGFKSLTLSPALTQHFWIGKRLVVHRINFAGLINEPQRTQRAQRKKN